VTRTCLTALQGALLRACWPQKGANKLATPLGMKSSSSDMASCEDLRKLHQPCTFDMIMKMFHLGNLSGAFSMIENCKKNSVDSISIVQKSAIEKPINDIIVPCKTLPNCDVVGQETSRPSLAEIVDLKSPNKSIEATSSSSMLGGQQNKGIGAGCVLTSLTGARTGLTDAQTGLTGGPPGQTTSPRLLHNKSKPKMVKPKNPEIGVWKKLNLKVIISMSQRQNNVDGASRSKNSKPPKSSPKEKFHMRIGNGVTLTNQCHFLHMDHQCLCHVKLILICIIFVLHGIIIHICHLLLVPFCPNCINYRESMINVPSSIHNDHFDQKNQSTCKTKRKVINQVYRVKKDGRLNKNSDFTLDTEKPTIEKSSASSLIKLSLIMNML
jgi:hypothetical protein